MTSPHPLCSARIASVLGQQGGDVPTWFAERLERMLEQLQHDASTRPPKRHLAMLPALDCQHTHDTDALNRSGYVAVSLRVLQSLDTILEILHAEHLAREDGCTDTLLGEHLVDGLLVAARQLIKTCDQSAIDAA